MANKGKTLNPYTRKYETSDYDKIRCEFSNVAADWLAEKGMTITDFTRRVHGAKYNTVYRWFRMGVIPGAWAQNEIARKFRDCPLVIKKTEE